MLYVFFSRTFTRIYFFQLFFFFLLLLFISLFGGCHYSRKVLYLQILQSWKSNKTSHFHDCVEGFCLKSIVSCVVMFLINLRIVSSKMKSFMNILLMIDSAFQRDITLLNGIYYFHYF